MYTRFCYYYQQFAAKNKATLHMEHKPGDPMEVDWAGDTIAMQDTITGKPIPVYLFVAVLSSSGYAYAEGFLARGLENWISAHVNAYQFFGGATRILVPDNLKPGVTKCLAGLTARRQHIVLRRPVWINLGAEVPPGFPGFPHSKNQPAKQTCLHGSPAPSDQSTTFSR
jgi:transposase